MAGACCCCRVSIPERCRYTYYLPLPMKNSDFCFTGCGVCSIISHNYIVEGPEAFLGNGEVSIGNSLTVNGVLGC